MSKKPWSVWIGFDPRPEEMSGFAVARDSIRKFHRHVSIRGLVLSDLIERGLYYRPTERRLGKLFDVISDHAMSTEFAVSRFLAPVLCRQRTQRPYGWAVYMDCDVLVRSSLSPMIEGLDDTKALYCVQHDHRPTSDIKMDGQRQSWYPRKNWSSVMAINCDHAANNALTAEYVNTVPSLALHQFHWLSDENIGELSPVWNHLVGYTEETEDPKVVHFTEGLPNLTAYRNVPFADEWFAETCRWAA